MQCPLLMSSCMSEMIYPYKRLGTLICIVVVVVPYFFYLLLTFFVVQETTTSEPRPNLWCLYFVQSYTHRHRVHEER